MKVLNRAAPVGVGVIVLLSGTITPAQAANDYVTKCAGGTVVANRTANYAATQTDGPCRNVSVALRLTKTRKWSNTSYSTNGLVERRGQNYKSRHTWLQKGTGHSGSVMLP